MPAQAHLSPKTDAAEGKQLDSARFMRRTALLAGNTQLFFSLGSWVLVNPRRHERPLVPPG
jgi:hypothetical protein